MVLGGNYHVFSTFQRLVVLFVNISAAIMFPTCVCVSDKVTLQFGRATASNSRVSTAKTAGHGRKMIQNRSIIAVWISFVFSFRERNSWAGADFGAFSQATGRLCVNGLSSFLTVEWAIGT